MKRVGDLLLLITTLVGVAWAGESELVAELTDKNIDTILKENEFAVVKFYAPWCGYCQDFAPIYEEAAKRIRKANDTILVAKLNADEFDEAAEVYDIEGLPTIKWFVNGTEKYEYGGQPSIENFMRWVTKVSTSPAVDLSNVEDMERSSNAELSITGVFDEYKGDVYDAFMELALSTDDIVFFKSMNKTLMQVEGTPALIFRKNLPGHPKEVIRKSVIGKGDPSEEIYNFMDKHRYPDFYIFDSSKVENMMITLELVEREYHVHIVVPEAVLQDKSLLENAREAGKEIRDNSILVLSARHENSPLNAAFDIQDIEDVQTFAAHTLSIRKYALPPVKKDMLEPQEIVNFTKLAQSGDNMHRVYASSPLPEEKEENGVHILVRKNFEEITGNPKRDVVVLSLHPDSDESLELEEAFENLAKALINITSIVLAKFDGSTNEHELVDYPMAELPKVTMFGASEASKPVTMDDSEEMDVESLGKFIHQNAAIEFNLPDLSEYKTDKWEDWNAEDDEDASSYEEEEEEEQDTEKNTKDEIIHEEL